MNYDTLGRSREEMIHERQLRDKRIYLDRLDNMPVNDICDKYKLGQRTIMRILREGKEGKLDDVELPKVQTTHEFLTSGIYKKRAPHDFPIPYYG